MLPQSDVLNSWKEISNYIGRGVRTVQRWEKDFGMPVRRPSGHLRGSVFAMRRDIDQWLKTCEARENGELHPVVQDKTRLPHAAYSRFVENTHQLKQRIESLEFNAKALETSLRRTRLLREKLRGGSVLTSSGNGAV